MRIWKDVWQFVLFTHHIFEHHIDDHNAGFIEHFHDDRHQHHADGYGIAHCGHRHGYVLLRLGHFAWFGHPVERHSHADDLVQLFRHLCRLCGLWRIDELCNEYVEHGFNLGQRFLVFFLGNLHNHVFDGHAFACLRGRGYGVDGHGYIFFGNRHGGLLLWINRTRIR